MRRVTQAVAAVLILRITVAAPVWDLAYPAVVRCGVAFNSIGDVGRDVPMVTVTMKGTDAATACAEAAVDAARDTEAMQRAKAHRGN